MLLGDVAGAAAATSELTESLRRSTVQVHTHRSGGGSGVIWRADGLIITNAHVARGKRLSVELSDGTEHRAELTARDDERDVAALRVGATELPAASIADSDVVRPGQLVLAVGNPLGLVGAVTSGIIFAAGSSRNRRVRWLQADVHIAPGNSGGPLADAHGRVIGINSMIYGGLAVAVPSNAVERFVRGTRARPRLGVVVEPVNVGTGRMPALGLLVFEVAADSAAARNGLLPGDAIVQLDGKALLAPDDLSDALADNDGQLRLTVRRGPATIEV
ncbi:MAG TPA: trypsin-like peptidase domain-containing protein, partial [Candidatus Eremiobacteraceae bacterium]|nr:trypsin-like peptidase domain-containing protein [Candidatus Eremiobacteraceae bacterium]